MDDKTMQTSLSSEQAQTISDESKGFPQDPMQTSPDNPPQLPSGPWIRRTAWFLGGQTVSLFGSALVQYAIVWYITLTTQSGVMMTLSTLFGFLPQILISLPAGVWADRYSRKRLIVGADALTAITTLILALVFLSGHGSIVLIFAASALRSIGAGIQMPAVTATLPQLVPPDKLMKVNGINGAIQSVTFLLAPAVSGAMMATWKLESIFFVDVVTAALAIGIIASIALPPHAREGQEAGSQWRDLQEGLKYLWDHAFLKNLIGYYFVIMFLVVPAAFLTPLMVTRSFGPEIWKLTVNEIAFGAGTTLGGFLMAAWGGFKNRIHTIAYACIAFGALILGMGISPVFWIYLVVLFITGVTLPSYNIASMTLLQEQVENTYQGRVFSFVQIGSSAAMPLGMVLFGPLADVVRIETLLIFSGVLLVLTGTIMMIDRKMRCAEGGCAA